MLTRRNLGIASALYASLLLLSVDCDLATKRLQKELNELQKDPPPGVKFDFDSMADNLNQWIVDMEGAKGTLFEGENFQLRFKFGPRYPLEQPVVQFIGNIPKHPHIYRNGNVCISFLMGDWSPVLTVRSMCLSIISMLSQCTEKRNHHEWR